MCIRDRSALATAVDRLGGHSKLVKKLREMDGLPSTRSLDHGEGVIKQLEETITDDYLYSMSHILPIERSVPCNVLLLGKMGGGKSTLGNQIICSDGHFRINSRHHPQTCVGSAAIRSASQRTNYFVVVYDHDGLFDTTTSETIEVANIPSSLHLVLFIQKRGHDFSNERQTFDTIMSKLAISRISALVITHCECLSKKERKNIVDIFEKTHPSIADYMGKGIYTVGFPDRSNITIGTPLSESVTSDQKKIRELIYSCEAEVRIELPVTVEMISTQAPGKQIDEVMKVFETDKVTNKTEPPNSHADSKHHCCSIL